MILNKEREQAVDVAVRCKVVLRGAENKSWLVVVKPTLVYER